MLLRGRTRPLPLWASLAVLGVSCVAVVGCRHRRVTAPGTGLPLDYVLAHIPAEAAPPRMLRVRRPPASGQFVRVGRLVLGIPAGWRLRGPVRDFPGPTARVTFGLPRGRGGGRWLALHLLVPLRLGLETISDFAKDRENYWKPFIARQYGHVNRFYDRYHSLWEIWRAAYRTNLLDLKTRPAMVTRRQRCLMFLRARAFSHTRFWCSSGGVRAAICYGQPKLEQAKCIFAVCLFDGAGNDTGEFVVHAHGLAPRAALREVARLLAISRVDAPSVGIAKPGPGRRAKRAGK